LRYHTNALTTTQVLEELIKLAKDIRTARTRGEETASPTRKSRSMTRWPRTNTPHLAHQGKARSKAVLLDLPAYNWNEPPKRPGEFTGGFPRWPVSDSAQSRKRVGEFRSVGKQAPNRDP
jgi:hypothetical protein